MTLTIEKQEDEQRQLQLTIGVAETRIDQAMRQYAKKLARDLRIPGFRPGKAPYSIIMQRFGEEYLRYEVVEEMLNDLLQEALEAEQIVPYARPSLDNLDLSPTILYVTVPLEPLVDLGDYRAIRRDFPAVDVTEAAVDSAIEAVLERMGKVEEVERPAELGDSVKVTGVGALIPADAAEDWSVTHESEEQIFHDHNGTDFPLDAAKTFAGTEFVANLVGVQAGDERDFVITFPADYEVSDFSGRQAQFKLEILGVQSRDLPELTDELAKEVDESYETIADLRAGERQKLQTAAESQARSDFLNEMVETLRAQATLTYSPTIVTVELEERVDEMKKQVKQYGWEWDAYLKMQNITEEDLHGRWRDDAVQQVERSLILRQLIQAEKLTVDAAEIEQAVDERMGRFGDMEDEMKATIRQLLLGENGLQTMANDLMLDKVLDRLKAIVAGNAPDLNELEELATADDAAEQEATAEEA